MHFRTTLALGTLQLSLLEMPDIRFASVCGDAKTFF